MMAEGPASEERVLVLAPTGRDAALIGEMLGKDGLPCAACDSVEELAGNLERGAGLALLAEEALIGVPIKPLVDTLEKQPAWSDFPLLFLTTTGAEASATSTRLLRLFGDKANVTILERPIRVATLLSTVRSALRARRRQYEVRDHLEERSRSNEKLLQTQKLESLGVLAGGIAHDFNNLLVGIIGNASLLAEEVAPGSQAAELVQDLEQAGSRASQLTQQMLAYSGRGRFKIELLDLGQQVREITPLIRSSIAKNVELQLNVSDDLPLVEADAAQMQQLIMNLIINGAEAIGASGGKVVVSTATEQIDQLFAESLSVDSIDPGRYVLLRVRDTGRGMDPEVKAKIFDPFFTTKFTGRGLGLAAVIGIVRGHRGAIRVESEPDKGATFSAYFPAVECEAKPKNAAPSERTAAAGTVLIVDDEDVVLKVAKMSLEKAGFTVLAAENGQEAVDLLAAPGASVDIVLLDMTMPVMSGEEALRELKRLRPDVPVIASSGYNEVEALRRFGHGIAGFIQKPYSAPELIAQVEKALRPAIG